MPCMPAITTSTPLNTHAAANAAAIAWAQSAAHRIDALFVHIDRALDHLRTTDTELGRFRQFSRA